MVCTATERAQLLHLLTKIGTSPSISIRRLSNFYRETIDKFATKVRLSIFDSWFRREMVDVET